MFLFLYVYAFGSPTERPTEKNIHAIDGHLREESSQKEQISILIANRRIYV